MTPETLSSTDPRHDRLFDLLPQVIRDTDAYAGSPLRALLRVMGEQLACVEDDVAGLYENAFVETCDEWALPYLAELVGRAPVAAVPVPPADDSPRGRARARAAYPRAAFARTLAARRRKGVLLQLEELADDLAGWAARIVEFRSTVAAAGTARFPDRAAARTVDVRAADRLDRTAGPFADLPRRPDLRRVGSARTVGRGHLTALGLYVWRLKVNAIRAGRAFEDHSAPPPTPTPSRHRHHDRGAEYPGDYRLDRYILDPLGLDRPLFTRPNRRPEPTGPAEEHEVPGPIRPRALLDRPDRYYGPDKSLYLWRTDPQRGGPAPTDPPDGTVVEPGESFLVHDLKDWDASLPPHHPATAADSCWEGAVVDPARGRVLYRRSKTDHKTALWARYHPAAVGDLGGGGYFRDLAPVPEGTPLWVVGGPPPADPDEPDWFPNLRQALRYWNDPNRAKVPRVVIEIRDDGRHRVGADGRPLETKLRPGESLEVRAAEHRRPVVRHRGRPDDHEWVVTAESGAGAAPTFVLDGLLLADIPVRLFGAFAEVRFRHCTLYDGPKDRDGLALVLESFDGCVSVESSVIHGAVHVRPDRFPFMCDPVTKQIKKPDQWPPVERPPVRIVLADSILAGSADDRAVAVTGWRGDLPAPAVADEVVQDHPPGHVALTVLRCTVFGHVNVHALDLAEDSIFVGRLRVTDTTRGCVRYSSLQADEPRTPPRHACQPDLALAALPPTATPEETAAAVAAVAPRFTSVRFADPAYAQLARDCPPAVSRGASDESEMGAFHDLYQPYRAALLRADLAGAVPADADAAVFFVT